MSNPQSPNTSSHPHSVITSNPANLTLHPPSTVNKVQLLILQANEISKRLAPLDAAPFLDWRSATLRANLAVVRAVIDGYKEAFENGMIKLREEYEALCVEAEKVERELEYEIGVIDGWKRLVG